MSMDLNDGNEGPMSAQPPIQYVECPHCHHDVMVRPNGICLACGKDQNDKTGTNPDMTMLTVENISKLPANCFLCGVETQRMQTFRMTYRTTAFSVPSWALPLARMMAYVPGMEFSTTDRLRLPTCLACGKQAKRVKPLSIWSGLDCRILVHRIFRERFEALNGTKSIDFEWEAETRMCTGSTDEPVLLSGVGKKLG